MQVESQLTSATSRAFRAEQLALEATQNVVEPLIVQEGDLKMTGPELVKESGNLSRNSQDEPCPPSPFGSVSWSIGWRQRDHPVQVDASSINQDLEKKSLPKTDVVSIACEVVQALSHLHHFQPQPVIHRSVNSGNVLLEPLQKKWRAKLFEFGSNNFIYYTADSPTTNNPANLAPEATSAADSSPKLDIFSFGIFLLEMASRHVPPTNPFGRDHHLDKLKWPKVTSVVQSCISATPTERPDIEAVCQELLSIKQ